MKLKKRQTSPYHPLPLKKTVVRENLEHISPISFGGLYFLKLPRYEWSFAQALRPI